MIYISHKKKLKITSNVTKSLQMTGERKGRDQIWKPVPYQKNVTKILEIYNFHNCKTDSIWTIKGGHK